MAIAENTSCILVIFGGTGDLANRKLYPALYSLKKDGLLPSHFAVVSVGRREFPNNGFRDTLLLESIKSHGRHRSDAPEDWDEFASLFSYLSLDLNDPEGYHVLKDMLEKTDVQNGTEKNIMFYLAVGPEMFSKIVHNLECQGLLGKRKGYWRRVVIEKPFGRDWETAYLLNQELLEVLQEEQIYRIDHYLGKEMIQNIMVIRFTNTFFEPLWNNKYVDNVQITSAETVGVEDRGNYYDKSGALRDMLQNHMLQLVTLIAMEPPSGLDTESIRSEKVKVLRSLKTLNREVARKNFVRGQYGEGEINRQRNIAYRQEPKVSPASKTETFVAAEIYVENFRWAGVPFYLRTGKRLPAKSMQIVVQFKSLPEVLYAREVGELETNVLVIRIQPLEGVFIQLNAKRPGTKNVIVPIRMDFCQTCAVGINSPEAYERLLYDVMRGDPTLFSSWEEVEYSWKYVDPVLTEWSDMDTFFPNYAAGLWGPEAAQSLLIRSGRKWWNI